MCRTSTRRRVPRDGSRRRGVLRVSARESLQPPQQRLREGGGGGGVGGRSRRAGTSPRRLTQRRGCPLVPFIGGFIRSTLGFVRSTLGFIRSSLGFIRSSPGFVRSSLGLHAPRYLGFIIHEYYLCITQSYKVLRHDAVVRW